MTGDWPADQDLVPEPAHQVEAQVHQRPGDAGAAVLLIAGHLGAEALVHRRQIMVTGHIPFTSQSNRQ